MYRSGCSGGTDGPMLEALKQLNGGIIHLPNRIKERPDRARCGGHIPQDQQEVHATLRHRVSILGIITRRTTIFSVPQLKDAKFINH
jgi:hypothetical protein